MNEFPRIETITARNRNRAERVSAVIQSINDSVPAPAFSTVPVPDVAGRDVGGWTQEYVEYITGANRR